MSVSQEIVTEAMVIAKEQENALRRARLREHRGEFTAGGGPAPNFPPRWFCCGCLPPVVYHNIRGQVPVRFQPYMYALLACYALLVVLLIYNIVAALFFLLKDDQAKHFGLSFLYLLGVPGAWIFWYYSVYCALVYSSRPRRLLAGLGLVSALGFDAWMAVGVRGFGGCGWLATFGQSRRTGVAFIMLLVSSVLWTLHCAVMCVMLVVFLKLWRTLRDRGMPAYQADAMYTL